MNVQQPLSPAVGTAPDPDAVDLLPGPDAVLRSMDRCTKCGICQAHCPVAAVTERFPGPKYSGPQAARFRAIDPVQELAPALCSGCGICTSVCPNEVAITDIITLAKADMVVGGRGLSIGQKLLNRPDLIGRVAGLVPGLSNALLSSPLLRGLAERIFGLHRKAPLPAVEGPAFRRWLAARRQPDGPRITYFTGCAIEHYDPGVGRATVAVLNHLGYHVEAPSGACCGLPMLSSGELSAARGRAESLIAAFAPGAKAGQPLVATSTSCSLTLKSKYAAYLDLRDEAARALAAATFDICEFLRERHFDDLARDFKPLASRVLYHAPCQLRGHAMGFPAAELLGLIPELEVIPSNADCCGIGGTYGYDRERFAISQSIGRTLKDQAEAEGPTAILCDSETCRWHIAEMTGLPARHPIELIAESLLGDETT